MGDYLTPVGNTTLIRDYNPDGFKQVFYGPDMLKKLFDFSSDSFSKFAFYFENGPHAVDIIVWEDLNFLFLGVDCTSSSWWFDWRFGYMDFTEW
jgi:hypothetical protein